ncbi:DUF3492 domain-containing protein [Streptomyces marincola]|uniref:D-inositol 3-phosphate glycosyltransferase n=1 Tax=Streptomyces marincola TaxID=2878388 RepID=A0A1W7CV88_9ACTN|nr:DUF3492 domain-containing protein [Streptomyces marincola]ARQ68733.1 hypothetical protein CAG99_07580 [Streptomyces marincola]
MRVALLTEGGYPFAQGESAAWCDRLLHGLPEHEFDVLALSRFSRQERGPRRPPPGNVREVRTAPLWGAPRESGAPPGATRAWARVSCGLARRFAASFAELAAALCPGDHAPGEARSRPQADRFADGLYGLADLAAAHGGLGTWLRSEDAVRVLGAVCRARHAPRAVRGARVADLLAVADRLERALRPLSLDWWSGPRDLSHAVGTGPAALAGLVARHRHGTPLLITEYGARLREHHLADGAGPGAHAASLPAGLGPAAVAHAVAGPGGVAPVRALLAAFRVRLAREAYRGAALITPGDPAARRRREGRGPGPGWPRTVRPEPGTGLFCAVPATTAPPTLLRVGRAEPDQDLDWLLRVFRDVRAAEPAARLRVVATPARGRADTGHLARCRALAARLVPSRGRPSPVTFTEVGTAEVPTLADAYAGGGVVVRCGAARGYPPALIEAMFRARAIVSTDTGAVVEAVGDTGLVVPHGDRAAFAAACVSLLRDPARGARLGAAARARALDLFSVERDVAAFAAVYREVGHEGVAASAGAAARAGLEPIRAATGGRGPA